MSKMQEFDNQGYDDGKRMYGKGDSLRTIIERFVAGPQVRQEKGEDWEAYTKRAKAEEAKVMSMAIGFADAFLADVRAMSKASR